MTRHYDLLLPRNGQKEPPRLGTTICYGQTWARKSHQDSAVRFVTANSWPERATKTRQYDLLRPSLVQKEPARLGSTICYGQELARKSHQDSAVRFVTAKPGPERATKTRQYDLLRPNVCQKEPPRLGSTICYGQELARKSHQDSAVRFVTVKPGPERATKTRQYDLLRPRVGRKEPPRLGSTICYGQTWARKSHQASAVRFATAKSWPDRDWAIQFVTAKRGPERATETRQYDLLRPRVGQKKPPRLGRTICDGQAWARKSHQDSAVRFVTAKSWPERATKTRQYDLLRPRVWPERATETRQYDLSRPRIGQKEPPGLGITICYCQTWARKSRQDSALRFVTAKSWPEGASKTWQYDLLRSRVVQKEPARLGFVTAKSWPERATRTRQDYLLRPNVGQKEPPRLGTTICYGQRGPERATKTRQYDLLRPNVGQKEPP